jgi:hypothetical protein
MFYEFVDRGRQICCTESFFNLFLKYFLNINNLVLFLTYLNLITCPVGPSPTARTPNFLPRD